MSHSLNRAQPLAGLQYQRYPATLERCHEVLRLALTAMTRSAARPTPVAYAVWFEHFGGLNAGLSSNIEALRKQGCTMSDDDMTDLYRSHIMDLDVLMTQKIGDEIGGVLNAIQTSVGESRISATGYQNSLQKFQDRLHIDATHQDAGLGVDAILEETGTFSASVEALDDVLESSRHEIERLKLELVRVREEVFCDALTGLTNRRGFDSALAKLTTEARASQKPLALIMLDIDHFKRINDGFGHVVGDRVITGVGSVIAKSVKDGDVAARYGGEEFAILLPNAPQKMALEVAERVRESVGRASIKRLDKQESVGNVTISGGVTFMRVDESMANFINRADQALYSAKNGGRNRVVFA